MKKHITIALFIAVLAGAWSTGCAESKNDSPTILPLRLKVLRGTVPMAASKSKSSSMASFRKAKCSISATAQTA